MYIIKAADKMFSFSQKYPTPFLVNCCSHFITVWWLSVLFAFNVAFLSVGTLTENIT